MGTPMALPERTNFRGGCTAGRPIPDAGRLTGLCKRPTAKAASVPDRRKATQDQRPVAEIRPFGLPTAQLGSYNARC